MWSASEERSGTMEGGPPEAVVPTKETCEQNKNQLESLKEIMMRNQQSLKKKEEEVQEYARRLSKIKSRAKLSRRSKEGSSSSKDTPHSHKTETAVKDATDDTFDDTSQAITPKAKSSLLQRKLAENRKAFEQRSKELTETKRAVEEKVEAIRQQLDETDLASAGIHKEQLPVTPVRPLVVTPDVLTPIQIQDIQEKENKIMQLSNKIRELEATVLDLQENLKEKDSVIDSKTKAVTLMSADLSKKGKTTLDTLENTKDEMRMMQENFVLLETSLKNKNSSLLEQLQERDNRISELEHTISSFEEQLKEQKIAESASVDFSRSTMDTLAETKDAMKSMQENFVFIESSLKLKNDNLLQQLEEYEVKLAEAKERIFQLESGAGIVTTSTIEDLQFKIERLEQSNRQLLDEKYELQKNIAEIQDQIVNRSNHDNNAVTEKDNRIAELEDLVERLEQSNELQQKESTAELHQQLAALSSKNEEYSEKMSDFEKQIHQLKAEKDEIAAKVPDSQAARPKEDDKVIKLTKELDELNKSMIKLKAQHRSKIKNLQKQLENFKMVSDTNAELVRLGNQVALLEEEKGNLQLSLVDFDELKASAGDWQERVADLESKVSSQTKEIQMHIDAIATLENQKLDLTQELHTVKQEVSALEAENAESENLRVSAEMKVVELEEQLEAAHKEQHENKLESLYSDSDYNELLKKIDVLTLENSELYAKLSKVEEKGASDTGSTESFEAIQVNDRNDLLKKIEELEQKNNELTLKLTKLEEKDSSHAGSTESFETINDTDRGELLKKIEQLTQENSDLTMKLSRIEEKGSSDTGSTESFERIPEHSENMAKIELLTQENHELVIKLTKLEEHLSQIENSNSQPDGSKIDRNLETLGDSRDLQLQVETIKRENDDLTEEISKFKTQVEDLAKKNVDLQDYVEVLLAEKLSQIPQTPAERTDFSSQTDESAEQQSTMAEEGQARVRREVSEEESINTTSSADDTICQIAALEVEKARLVTTIAQLEEHVNGQNDELNNVRKEKEELSQKLEYATRDDFAKERLELISKLEKLSQEKESVAQERQELHEQISTLLRKSSDQILEMPKTEEAACQESQTTIVTALEKQMENNKLLITEYKNQIEEMSMKLQSMETKLEEKVKQLTEHEASSAKLESLERELKEMFVTAEEWKFKYEDMQAKMQTLEEGKASIEDAFRKLESDNKELLGVIKEKDAATSTLQEQLEGTIGLLEAKLQDKMTNANTREREIADLKAIIENKDQELQAKYMQLQNELIAIDSLQDELTNYTMRLKEKDVALSSSLKEISRLNDVTRQNEEEVQALRDNVSELSKALQQSSLVEFDEISERLRNAEASCIELESKHENVLKENNELSRKLEDVAKHDEDIENELTKKTQEIADLLATKEYLGAQIDELTNDKTEAEKRIRELQMILENHTAYIKQIQSDLQNEYKQMEQLKIKHTEDMAMLNQRLEDVIEDLTAKEQENEALRAQLEQNEKLLAKNVTEETKIVLQSKVADLEQKLSEAENKLQMQSEKMKKIVATFNKKKIACQELEARVAELEEKWTTEKDEKEVKNKKIQEVENSMREKDNKIADLEEKLLQTRDNTEEAVATSEKLAKELTSLKEKMAVLMEQIAEMGEEIERQRAEIERVSLLEMTERTAKEDIAKEYELYKQTVAKENERKQAILDEVKEEARELSVRMQVMETEYVEQLALIKNLQAENGLLSSKQTQINEKLENAEKESEERRVLIEELQKQIAITAATAAVQVSNEDAREDDARAAQHCDHPDQCQNLVQALESRLQEREAEIENLNNELANSYGNIVLLHDESLRYNDMMMQTAQERFNQSLMDRTNTLQREIETLRTEKITSERRVSELEDELNEHKRKNTQSEETGLAANVDSQRQQDRDDTPQLFDASKIFGATAVSDADTLDKNEMARLQSVLNEKESQCSEHMKEILLLRANIEEEKLYMQKLQAQCDSQVEHWRNQLENAQGEVAKVERLNLEKSAQINSLIAELEVANQRISTQMRQRADAETDLQNEISLKDNKIIALKTELSATKETAEALTTERDRQSHALESYKLQIDHLETEAKNINDSDLIRELEQRISAAVAEKDLLQLQVNDLTRSMEELIESSTTHRNLQIDLENALREKDQAQALVASLTQTLEDSRQNLRESKERENNSKELASSEIPLARQEWERISTSAEEPIVNPEEDVQSPQALVEKEEQEKRSTEGIESLLRDVDSKWEYSSSEKLNVDEESWGWNAEDVQLAGDQQLGVITKLIPDAVQLRAQLEDLQDKINDLEVQNIKIAEESKAAQVKNAKLVKKLKEYKVQIESLQQQLKTQKQMGGFFDLDTAIEEELKAQIANLEKAIDEIKEEKKNIITEKEALLKRLDVVVSANERYMEMKERQDMEVEVLRIQNKELGNKVQSLEWRLQESATETDEDTSSTRIDNADKIEISRHQYADAPITARDQLQERSLDTTTNIYKEEIDDLKDELEALAAENEQLQHFLEQQKATIANLESKITADGEELADKLSVLNNQNAQLQSALNISKEEYDVLRKRYEQSLMDANDQVAAMRQNSDLLRIEFSEKIETLEAEVNNLRKALEEKEALESKIDFLTEGRNSEEELSTINASLVEVTELLNARVQEVADLKQELQNQYVEKQQAEAALQFEIKNLMGELDERKRELETLRQMHIDKEHELLQQRSVEAVSAVVSEATQELVQKHAIEIEGKDKELHHLTEKLTALQLMVDEYVSELRDNTAKLETQHQEIIHLKRDLTVRDSAIEALKADADLMDKKLQEKQQQLIKSDEDKLRLAAEMERCSADIQHLRSQLDATETITVDLEKCNSHIRDLEGRVESLTSEKESILWRYDQEIKQHQAYLENDKQQIDVLTHDLREKAEQLHHASAQLCEKENVLETFRIAMTDKDSLLEMANQELNKMRIELENLRSEQSQSSKMIDGLPVFKMSNPDDDTELLSTIDTLKTQMEAKQQELEHLKYVLSENTYPTIIQQMQDRINCLYNEKATLEASLRTSAQTLTEKQEQVNFLTQRVNEQNQQERISKEEVNSLSRDRRSAHDQEEIVRLQNEMHAKEQEINELKYIIAEKDSQLCLQASMEPQSDEFELRETVQRLTGELYSKEQEVLTLKSTVAQLQEDLSRLQDLERLSEDNRNAIERLNSEKELIRNEAEEFLNRELQRKEAEIGEIKHRLSAENQMLSAQIHSKSSDIEALQTQLMQLRDEWNNQLQRKENELMSISEDLMDKERRLAELSITKDAELHNLNVQIREKEARIEELLMLSAEEEKQLNELRQTLIARETDVVTLKELLEQKVSEYEVIQQALKRDVSVIEAAMPKSSEDAQTADNKEAVSNELDLALYMLHQRDVRCEELTHELMQLLEERDTLQLRLSNAIRVNEELRRVNSADASPTKEPSSVSPAIVEPIVEQPSPSRSEGPIEIAREAIDAPIEDKEALALKLSQLHSVSHTKDVRLKDERELRHTQQMSLLAHRDVLSTLPPEAAARLVNANYTLSRDVQSQSSVLLNWLWGKSTPKVVHM